MAETGGTEKLAVLRQMIALQSRVCYMNVDRTLATWTRTALTLIVFGTVVDRYGLLLTRDHLAHVGTRLAPNPLSSLGGIVLVALGVSMVTAAAIRHQAYRAIWHRVYGSSEPFGPWLACTFAVMVAIFGICILAVLLADLR